MLTRSRFGVYKPSPLDFDQALVGWWPFDDGTATDFSGNQNNGFATGTPVFSTSEMGNSFGFSTGNYFLVTTPGNSNPITTNRVTVSAWVKVNSTARGDICSVWDNGPSFSTNQFVLLHGVTTGKPEFYISDGVSTWGSGVGTTTISAGLWYHIVGTYDGASIDVFVNGQFEHGFGLATTLGTGVSNEIQIGGLGGSAFPFDGSLADVRVYNRYLQWEEIIALYSRGPVRFQLSPDEWEMPALSMASVAASTNFSAFSTPQFDGWTVNRMIGY